MTALIHSGKSFLKHKDATIKVAPISAVHMKIMEYHESLLPITCKQVTCRCPALPISTFEKSWRLGEKNSSVSKVGIHIDVSEQ